MRFDDAFNEIERQLIEGFLNLAEGKPYDKISVKELTARCHVARTSFYRYFEDTLDMLECLEEYLLGKLVLYRSSRACGTKQTHVAMTKRGAHATASHTRASAHGSRPA